MKGNTDGRNTKQAAPEVRVLKTATCASTSGKSKLTYEVGSTPDSEVHLRITANTGSGAISQNWVSFRAIRDALKCVLPGDISSGHMHPLYAGKSVNTRAFLLAALISEGLVRPSTTKRRCYECSDDAAFEAAINAWNADGDGKSVEGAGTKGNAKPTRASKKKPIPPPAVESVASAAPSGPPTAMDSIPCFTAIETSTETKTSAPRKTKSKRSR